MEFYILDKNFQRVYPLDTYTSLIWTDRYTQYGDFEITTPYSSELYYLFQLDTYIWNSESKHLMVIENINLTTDVETGNTLTISGRSTEGSFLDRRIIWNRTILDGKFQNVIEKILNDNVINPSDSKRRIPNIRFQRTNDAHINSLWVNKQEIGETVYSTIEALCQTANVGFRMVFENNSTELVFELYNGVDRSLDQLDRMGVIFSPTYDNLINSTFSNSHTEYRNVALVAGEGEGVEQKFYTAGAKNESGLLRRELFVDGSDISSLIESNKDETDKNKDPDYGDSPTEKIAEYESKIASARSRIDKIIEDLEDYDEEMDLIDRKLKDPNLSENVKQQAMADLANIRVKVQELNNEKTDLENQIPLYELKIQEYRGELEGIDSDSEAGVREDLYAKIIERERQIALKEAQIDSLKNQLPDVYLKRVEVKEKLDDYNEKYVNARKNLDKEESEFQKLDAEVMEAVRNHTMWTTELAILQREIDEWESQHGQDTTDATILALQTEKAQKEARLKEIEAELKKLEHPDNPNKPGSTTNAFENSSYYKEYSQYLDKKATSEKKLEEYDKQIEELLDELEEIKKELASAAPGSITENQLKLEKINTEKEIARLEVAIDTEEKNIAEYNVNIQALLKKLEGITNANEKKREELYKETYEINLRLDVIEELLEDIDATHPQMYQKKVELMQNIESAKKIIDEFPAKRLEYQKKKAEYEEIIKTYPAIIEDLRKQYAALNAQINQYESNDTWLDVQNQINALEAEIDALEAEIERYEEGINNIENPPSVKEEKKYLTAEQYNALLNQRGLEELSEHKTTLVFDGKVEPKIQYEYGVDYFVGDLVQLENEYGMSEKVRVTEFIISQSVDGYEAYPTFEGISI